MKEGLGELIDDWARILIPGAYAICMSTIMCMDMDDGYKADGMAPMYSAMGNYTFKPMVAIAPILVTLGIGGWIAFRGKAAFSLKQYSESVHKTTVQRHHSLGRGMTASGAMHEHMRGAMHPLVEIMRLHLEAEASGSRDLSRRSSGQSGAITLEDNALVDVAKEVSPNPVQSGPSIEETSLGSLGVERKDRVSEQINLKTCKQSAAIGETQSSTTAA